MLKIKYILPILIICLLATPAWAQNQRMRGEQAGPIAERHAGEVADFVRTVLDVADRPALGGIGEQVREVAREQQRVQQKVEPLLNRIENRSRVRNFIFGTDFEAVEQIRREMIQTRQRLTQLSRLRARVEDPELNGDLDEEILEMDQTVGEVLDRVEQETGQFSLFGWVKKLFR